eukprot:g19058.t1
MSFFCYNCGADGGHHPRDCPFRDTKTTEGEKTNNWIWTNIFKLCKKLDSALPGCGRMSLVECSLGNEWEA